eukprot:gene34227-41430_t
MSSVLLKNLLSEMSTNLNSIDSELHEHLRHTLQLKQKKLKVFYDMLQALKTSEDIAHAAPWQIELNERDPVSYLVNVHATADRYILDLIAFKNDGCLRIKQQIDGAIDSSDRVDNDSNVRRAFTSTESAEKRGICIKRANFVQRWDLVQLLRSLSCNYESAASVASSPVGSPQALVPSSPNSQTLPSSPPPTLHLSLTNTPGSDGTGDIDTALQGAFNTNTWAMKYNRK